MSPTNTGDDMAWMLLIMHMVALFVALMVFAWMLYLQRRARRENHLPDLSSFFPFSTTAPVRPVCWIAVRSASPESVKDALGIHRAAPCSWSEGLAGGHEFFISPRIHGWVIVTGVGLPTPTDDVDATFLFLTALSRKLGHVQFFYAEKFSRHHAWARLDDACVTRAYAWAGETIWNQGIETLPEIQTGMRIFNYGDSSASLHDAETNFERVPQLAARWSLDPAEVKLNSNRQAIGLAGESAWS